MSVNIYLPTAFLDKARSLLKDEQSYQEFVAACHRPLRKSIRVNTLKINVKAFKALAQSKSWTLTPIPWCQEGFWLTRPFEQEDIPLGNTWEHMLGLFYVQEASSMFPAEALFSSGSPDIVLDMAAAPGSKTTQLAAKMSNSGALIANELSASRMKGLFSNVQRCGVNNALLTHFDGKVFGDYMPNSLDAVLLDAPCGGEGTIRKDPDALKNWSHEALISISQVQKQLINSAFRALKPGGTLIYSTCTLSPEENQDVCEYLLQQHQNNALAQPLNDLFEGANSCVTPEGYLHVWPHIFDSEGFFIAAFTKRFETPLLENVRHPRNFPFEKGTKKQVGTLKEYLQQRFGYTFDSNQRVYVRQKEFWLFPECFDDIAGKVKYDRIGVKVAEWHSKGFRLCHEFAISFGHHFTQELVELNLEQLCEFLKGKDIPWSDQTLSKGEVLVSFNNFPVGLGKNLGTKIKNSLPRDLVKDKLNLQD